MTQEHPITPPQELVDKWALMLEYCEDIDVFTDVARWGADQELEACCNWVDANFGQEFAQNLRLLHRPKTPSLKDKALAALQVFGPSGDLTPDEIDALRRALESLPN